MIKKDITFICSDAAERVQFEPVADEAVKRGYSVTFTENPFIKCEIGFYCQHINFPQYSKFSVIMLHDIIQQYSNWPDIWFNEPWNKYDIGILPSKQWVNNWNKCSHLYYANPRIGVFEVGWPKADTVSKLFDNNKREELIKKYGLDIGKKTILYAPAWENDNKQDDFVKAMLELDVNILIKQAPWSSPKWLKERPDIYENVKKMNELHRNIANVTILNDKLNIFEAISISDVLVSEESSTMCEAVMMGIPAVSVSNWLIPDEVPSRYPKCDYDFVVETTKEELTNCVQRILNNYDEYKKKTKNYSKNNFSNIGNSSSIIMDILEDSISNNHSRHNKLANREIVFSWKITIQHELRNVKRELLNNYSEKIIVIKIIISLLRKLKKHLNLNKM